MKGAVKVVKESEWNDWLNAEAEKKNPAPEKPTATTGAVADKKA
jgi:heme/copper-type cytochrome/quinol oxidase subunit 2